MCGFVIHPHRVARQIDALHSSAHDRGAVAVVAVVTITIDRRWSDDHRGRRIRVVVRIVNRVIPERVIERVESAEQTDSESERIPEAVWDKEWIAPPTQPYAITAIPGNDPVDASAAVESRAAVVSAEGSVSTTVRSSIGSAAPRWRD